MSEEKRVEDVELTNEELEKVAGGVVFRQERGTVQTFQGVYPQLRPERIGTCNKCAEMGFMNTNLYKVFNRDIMFCLDEGHIYYGTSFDHTSREEAKAYYGI